MPLLMRFCARRSPFHTLSSELIIDLSSYFRCYHYRCLSHLRYCQRFFCERRAPVDAGATLKRVNHQVLLRRSANLISRAVMAPSDARWR